MAHATSLFVGGDRDGLPRHRRATRYAAFPARSDRSGHFEHASWKRHTGGQPWRFVRITDSGLRNRIHALVAAERQRTAEVLGPRGEEFLRLKVEGILSCGELLIAALSDRREAHVFGRRTLPEMDLRSVACAIQNVAETRSSCH